MMFVLLAIWPIFVQLDNCLMIVFENLLNATFLLPAYRNTVCAAD